MKEAKYKINGNTYNVVIEEIDGNEAHVLVNGTPYTVEIETKKSAPVAVKATKSVHHSENAPRASKPAAAPAPAAPAGGAPVKAPLPGTVLSIPVKVGDQVKAADTVLVLEAMKMENAIHAGRDGKIASISVNAGDAVLEGAVLMTIE